LLTGNQLLAAGYPLPLGSQSIYASYSILPDEFFERHVWEPDKLAEMIPLGSNVKMAVVTLAQLLGIKR